MLQPRRGHAWLASLLMFALLTCPPAQAQAQDPLSKGIELYEQAEFDAAQSALIEAVNSGALDWRSLAKAHAYLGLVSLARGQEQYARESFGRAKGQDPSFRLDPALHPPAALALYDQAQPIGRPIMTSTPAPRPAPSTTAPAPLAPPAWPEQAPGPSAGPSAKAASGYVIEVMREDVTIDQGGRQGVSMGQRFEIIETRTLVHPVTGREMVSQRQVAVVMVVEVQPDMATAKFVSGRLDLLAPGLEAKPLGEAPLARPKPPAFQRRPGSQMRIMVVAPELSIFAGRDIIMDRSSFTAKALADALLHYPKLDAFAPDEAMLGSLDRRRPSSMAVAMEKLAADAVLFWAITSTDDNNSQIRLSYSLYNRGSDSPAAKDWGMRTAIKAQRDYARIIAEWVAEELKLHK